MNVRVMLMFVHAPCHGRAMVIVFVSMPMLVMVLMIVYVNAHVMHVFVVVLTCLFREAQQIDVPAFRPSSKSCAQPR